MNLPADVLIDFLRREELRGLRHVYLDDEAREVLRELHRRRKSPPVPRAASSAPSPSASIPASPAPEPPAAVREPSPAAAVPTGSGTKAERLAALRQRIENDPAPRRLGSLRDTFVFATGNPESPLMLVGEAPGYQEEKLREPFVGPAGEQLNKILLAMNLRRQDVYISNIVKYRPLTPSQSTNNRKPTSEEIGLFIPYLRAEVEIIRPRAIIALGASAAEGLLGLTQPLGSLRNRWHDFHDIPVRVTYHPAYLLHGNAGASDKRRIWEDMLAVMEHLGMPVSEKQRGYFLPKA